MLHGSNGVVAAGIVHPLSKKSVVLPAQVAGFKSQVGLGEPPHGPTAHAPLSTAVHFW